MPDFKLSTEEAAQLAAYLLSASEKPRVTPRGKPPASADADRLARGRQIVQTSGCLNCHALGIENSFAAKPLSELPLGGKAVVFHRDRQRDRERPSLALRMRKEGPWSASGPPAAMR